MKSKSAKTKRNKTPKDWWVALGNPLLLTRDQLKNKLGVLKDVGFYCYVLWRSDKKPIQPFYVGQGQKGRVFHHEMPSEEGNNPHKDRIRKKLLKLDKPMLFSIELLDSEEDAKNKEIELIKMMGRHNNGGLLTNLTDGGEGTPGHIGLKGADAPNARPVVSEGIEYLSISDAAEASGEAYANIYSYCLTGKPGYYFVDEGQRERKSGARGFHKKPVSIKGEIFESLAEAERQTGRKYHKLITAIQNGHDGYFYISEGQRERKKAEKPVQIDGTIFESRKAAKVFFGIDVSQRLASSNYPDWIDLTGSIKKEQKRNQNQPITVNSVFYTSLVNAEKDTGINRSTLRFQAESTNFPNVVCEGIEKIERDPDLAKPSVAVTVAGVTYPTLSECARQLDKDINTVKGRCKSISWPDWTSKDPDLQKRPTKDGKPGLKRVRFQGRDFRSVNAASKATGVMRPTINRRCEDESNADWEYV